MPSARVVVWGTLVALLVCCLFIVGLLHGRDRPRSDKDGRRGHSLEGNTDYCYPSLPSRIATPDGRSVKLLTNADSLHDIVAWAERDLSTFGGQRFMSVGSDQLDIDCFVVLYDVGCGAYVYISLVYVQASQRKWQLLCMGPAYSTSTPFAMDYPYIDGKKGVLVFGTRKGKTLRTVDIAHPLSLLRERLDPSGRH